MCAIRALKDHPQPIFLPQDAGSTPMDKYRQHVNQKYEETLKNTPALQRWTTTHPHEFWIDLYDYLDITPKLPAQIEEAYDSRRAMSSIPPFFEGHRINYAENVLKAGERDPDAVALIGVREVDTPTAGAEEVVTWRQLKDKVRIAAHALLAEGVHEGDRVAALVSNSVLAVVLNLATAAIGAIFTSINPDLGVEVVSPFVNAALHANNSLNRAVLRGFCKSHLPYYLQIQTQRTRAVKRL